jgi:hypothetical protein
VSGRCIPFGESNSVRATVPVKRTIGASRSDSRSVRANDRRVSEGSIEAVRSGRRHVVSLRACDVS